MTDTRYTLRSLLLEVLLVAIGCAFIVPIYLMLTGSLKSASASLVRPFAIPTSAEFRNYATAWNSGVPIPFSQAMLTSIIITVASVCLVLVLGSIAAYVLARSSSRLSSALYVLFVFAIILPEQLGVVPLFVGMHHLGLTGNYVGMVTLYTGLLMPLAIILYAGFIRVLPRDYEDAACIDGASPTRTFFSIVLPLLRPITGTVAVLSTIIVWNDFFTQLIFTGGSSRETIPVAVYSFVSSFEGQWNLIFAAILLSILPIAIFSVIANKALVRGFTGGVKG